MRRKDREMSKEFGFQLVDKATFGVLSITDLAGNPLALPLSFGRRENTLYFHSAKSGQKTENIRDGAPVTVVFVGEHQVPSVLTQEEAQEIMKDPQLIRKLTRKIFTTEFESAIVRGIIHSVNDPAEKMDALKSDLRKIYPGLDGIL